MKKTILVVDDFNSIQKFLCETLEKRGYATIGASNGEEAYEILTSKTSSINLVLTDYNMPRCSGMELLSKIKSTPATSHIPVIFLTTESDPDKMRKAKEAGLLTWIRKPYQVDSFFAQIENALADGR